MAGLAGAHSLTINFGRRQIALEIKGGAKALAALAACERDLMTSWGFDPSQIAKPPEPIDPATFVQDRDYPQRAVQERRGGETGFRVRVDTEGKPAECAITEKSGNDDLDAMVCARVMQRARFKPATGKEGQPVAGLFATSVLWSPGRGYD